MDETLRAAVTDYNASEGYLEHGQICRAGAWGELKPGQTIWEVPTVRRVGFADITDGLSKTTLILERAALPDRYLEGGRQLRPHNPPKQRTWGNVGLWAVSAEERLNHIVIEELDTIINDDNLWGIYSFHPGGALVGFADGSTQFMSESTPARSMLALISRDGAEIVDPATLE